MAQEDDLFADERGDSRGQRVARGGRGPGPQRAAIKTSDQECVMAVSPSGKEKVGA